MRQEDIRSIINAPFFLFAVHFVFSVSMYLVPVSMHSLGLFGAFVISRLPSDVLSLM